MRFSGKRALVTGGGTGVGAVIAQALATEGAEVWIAGRRQEALDRVASGQARIHAVQGDVTDADSCAAMVAASRPDIVVANAGASLSVPFHRMTGKDLEQMLGVNVHGVFNVFSAALPAMRSAGQGRLIAIASTAGLKGYAYVSGYAAAKHAVVGMVRSLALELARTGVTVNAVCPGFTETPMLDASLNNIMAKTGRTRDEAKQALAVTNPQGRFVDPAEVADTVLWLAGQGASAITGQAISVSGGEVM